MARGIGKQFLLETQYRYLDPSDQSKGLPQPPLELDYDHSRQAIELPRPESLEMPAADLRTIIDQRRTVRAYAEQPLTVAELSWLLWATQGVQKVTPRPATLRPVPSAGARHAFETLLLVNRVDGIMPGLYRFVAGEHKLVPMNAAAGLAEEVARATWGPNYRNGERGDFHLDGRTPSHVLAVRRARLSLPAVRCRSRLSKPLPGRGSDWLRHLRHRRVYEDQLHSVLGIDGEEQFVVYLGAAGRSAAPIESP